MTTQQVEATLSRYATAIQTVVANRGTVDHGDLCVGISEAFEVSCLEAARLVRGMLQCGMLTLTGSAWITL